jgi:hypothetical protein
MTSFQHLDDFQPLTIHLCLNVSVLTHTTKSLNSTSHTKIKILIQLLMQLYSRTIKDASNLKSEKH